MCLDVRPVMQNEDFFQSFLLLFTFIPFFRFRNLRRRRKHFLVFLHNPAIKKAYVETESATMLPLDLTYIMEPFDSSHDQMPLYCNIEFIIIPFLKLIQILRNHCLVLHRMLQAPSCRDYSEFCPEAVVRSFHVAEKCTLL